MGVVALHMAGRVLDQGLARDLARGLRAAGSASTSVTIAIFGRPEPHSAHRFGGHAGTAELDLEPGSFERVVEQLHALELLHADLAEVERANR